MGLAGNLEDLALSDIIQIIHLSKKTGTLTLTNKASSGAIVFRDGLIIQAIGSRKGVNIFEILIQKGILNKDQHNKVNEVFNAASPKRSLASVLCEQSNVTEELLDNLSKRLIEKTVIDLLQWKEGTFDFDLDRVSLEEFGPEMDLIKLDRGLTPQSLFVEAARKMQTPTEKNMEIREISPPVINKQPRRKQVIKQVVPPPSDTIPSDPVEKEITLPENDTLSITKSAPESLTPSDEGASEKTIIILDDEKVFLDLITKKLKHKGFIVFGFTELDDALDQLDKLVKSNVVPILISDLILPSTKSSDGLGGIDFLDEINISYPYIPVIILSDQHDPHIRYQAYEHGARNYLYKPDRSSIKISEITREINRFGDELALCINNIFRERYRLQEMMTSITAIKGAGRPKPADLGKKKNLEPDPEFQKMKQIFYELQNPKETSEVILLVLRLASEHLERGILFLVQPDVLTGIGGFGNAMDGEAITTKIPSFRISLNTNSIFKQVLSDRKMFTGIPDQSRTNSELYKYIGKPFNEIVVAIPLLSEGRIIAIFYGDNGSRMKAIDNIVGLEIFVNQAGIALENALLQRKLKKK